MSRGVQTSFSSSFPRKHWLRMASFSRLIFWGSHVLTACEQYFSLFMGWARSHGIEWGKTAQAWVCLGGCVLQYVYKCLSEECVLCILSKLPQLRIMNIAVMLLGFLNHLPNYPSSFDLPNLLTHSLIIIFIRNDWQWVKAGKNR